MSTDDSCAVVAFYGTASLDPSDLSELYDIFLGWFSSLGFVPDRVAVSGAGHSGKQVGFARTDARLRNSSFRGVTGFALTAMTPGGKIPTTDFEVTAEYSGMFSYALVAARNHPAGLGGEMLSVSKDLARVSEPAYGIGYRRQVRLGPVFYAIGLTQGLGFSDSARDEAIRISRWADKGMNNRVYNDGKLRDVYSWNFLNQVQRDSEVEGKKLEDWIQLEQWKGSLRAFSPKLALWEVDEEKRYRIRESLVDAGLIFLARGPDLCNP